MTDRVTALQLFGLAGSLHYTSLASGSVCRSCFRAPWLLKGYALIAQLPPTLQIISTVTSFS